MSEHEDLDLVALLSAYCVTRLPRPTSLVSWVGLLAAERDAAERGRAAA